MGEVNKWIKDLWNGTMYHQSNGIMVKKKGSPKRLEVFEKSRMENPQRFLNGIRKIKIPKVI